MQVCKESSSCEFFKKYSQLKAFRKEHYNYFCFGPLAETCARRVYKQKQGSSPRVEYSPTGLLFTT